MHHLNIVCRNKSVAGYISILEIRDEVVFAMFPASLLSVVASGPAAKVLIEQITKLRFRPICMTPETFSVLIKQ